MSSLLKLRVRYGLMTVTVSANCSLPLILWKSVCFSISVLFPNKRTSVFKSQTVCWCLFLKIMIFNSNAAVIIRYRVTVVRIVSTLPGATPPGRIKQRHDSKRRHKPTLCARQIEIVIIVHIRTAETNRLISGRGRGRRRSTLVVCICVMRHARRRSQASGSDANWINCIQIFSFRNWKHNTK